MKTRHHLLVSLLILTTAGSLPGDAFQDRPAGPDVTEAPRFFVEGTDPESATLPLRSTNATVSIDGTIATVLLRQTYQNTSDVPIHASYVFPGSTRAAVHDLVFEVGDRRIRADLQERVQARQTFETARSEGKRAALLEQHRPNVFQMRVANIMPGATVAVELTYTESIERVGALHRFVFPTVVGPRYSEDPVRPDGSQRWVSSPFLTPDSPLHQHPPGFSFTATIRQPLALSRVGSPSHSLNIGYPDPQTATLSLDPSARGRADDRDIVLEFSTAGEGPQAGLMVAAPSADGIEPGTFLLTIEPPARPQNSVSIPREYIFILDVSGSMHGFPLEISRQVMRDLVADLQPGEKFNAIAFAGGHSAFSETGSVPVSPTSTRELLHWVDGHHGGGGTRLVPALDAALGLPKPEGHSRTVILLTDGYVTVEAEAFRQIASRRNGANCFAFGIGSSVNRHLIEGIARAGGGEPVIVTDPSLARESTDAFIEQVRNPILTDIEIEFEDWSPESVLPESQPDLFLHRPIEIVGRFESAPEGVVTIRGMQGSEVFESRIQLPTEMEERPGLVLLWARRMIRHLEDQEAFFEAPGVREHVLEIALRHRLLTRHTSFVAVEETIVNPGGTGQVREQPSPLPKGVSPLAISGGGIPGTPEPSTSWLLIFALLGIGTYRLLSRSVRDS